MAVGILLTTASLLIWLSLAHCQVLTPPYFNLAVDRRVEASSTCGEGVDDAELYCKLTGANPGSQEGALEYNVIQGQLCDHCDSKHANKSHPAEYAIDGTERWWQSPPLSRGLQFNRVNLTIHLRQVSYNLLVLYSQYVRRILQATVCLCCQLGIRVGRR